MHLKNIYLEIQGGLGNQLFQYALARNLKYKFGGNIKVIKKQLRNPNNTHRVLKLNELSLDYSLVKKKIDILKLYIYKLGFNIKKIEEKKNFFYQNINPEISSNIYLTGYWQSYKYFHEIKNLLYAEFFRDIVINANKFHGVLPYTYYESSFRFLKKKFPNAYFIIFSDDINWCKANILNESTVFIETINQDDVQEMKLMSMCSHFIIANSSFSWWPAFLSTNHNKLVVSPKNWISENIDLSDLIPNTWYKF